MDWKSISSRIIDGGMATPEEALALLEAPNRELLDILQAAYQLRHKYFGNTVSLHPVSYTHLTLPTKRIV